MIARNAKDNRKKNEKIPMRKILTNESVNRNLEKGFIKILLYYFYITTESEFRLYSTDE